MSRKKIDWFKEHWQKLSWPIVLVVASVAAWFTQDQWKPHANRFLDYIQNKKVDSEDDAQESALSETPDTLTLSPTAWKNIGLETATVTLRDFEKVVSVPAMVVERPGRSNNDITAPVTGVVTQVYPLEREAINPGDALFDLRLTHEDIVTAQTDFLANLQKLDVAIKELSRLQNIGEGVIPGKRIIEQQYVRDNVTAEISAKRQSLLLHGISEAQIAEMEKTREVLREITVVAPEYPKNHVDEGVEHQYYVQSINVSRGQSVVAGQMMAKLADHCLLYIEGQAFEDDSQRLFGVSVPNRFDNSSGSDFPTIRH